MQVHSLVDSHIILGEMVPFFFLIAFSKSFIRFGER